MSLSEAGDGTRTHDPQLGKLMLYQLSYTRVRAEFYPPQDLLVLGILTNRTKTDGRRRERTLGDSTDDRRRPRPDVRGHPRTRGAETKAAPLARRSSL